jgi:transposase-like protein
MSRSTISTVQLFERFPDQEAARIYLEGRLWPNGPVCPQCGTSTLTVRPNGFYRCNPCGKFTFSVREGTIFGRSKIPLHKWIYAMYLVVTARKGISSMQLAKEIGVTQKSAWFMLQRLREACSGIDMDKLRGIVEIDDTPKILDAITDAVLRYRPKPKTKAQRKRARAAKKAKGKG